MSKFTDIQSRTAQKLIYFIAALVLFVVVAGGDVGNRLIVKVGCCYTLGAIVAFWQGRETFGSYHKVNIRPICIWVGTLMMVAMFVLMLLYKEMLHHYDHASDTPTPATVGVVCSASMFPSLVDGGLGRKQQ